jgi:glycosyltransferase involved in cell wall biosynthesis
MKKAVCIVRQRDYYELPVKREAEALRNEGFEVDVICLKQKGKKKIEIINGVTLYRLPLKRKKGGFIRYVFDYFSFFFLCLIKVTSLNFRKKYSVIQVNTMPDFLVFATIIPYLLGVKIIGFMKEPTPELGYSINQSKFIVSVLKVIEMLVLKYVDLAFTVTEDMKQNYVLKGANKKKIHVILNCPDPEHLLKYDVKNYPDPKYFTIICHGAIEERYGQDTILKAINLVKYDIPNLRFRLIGDGSFVENIKQMIDEMNLNDIVEYLGFVSMPVLVKELRKSDIGIVAQKYSPYSNLVHTNKMYEYIIFDKAAIISKLDSVNKYFDNKSMYYFEPGDPKSLANGILDLYENPSKREELVINSKRLFKKYSWANQKRIYINSFKSLISND